MRTLKAGDLSVWQIKQEEETVQFALSSMEFIIQGRKLLIAGMKNIHSALDNRETEAWQKLIRVLTHEIMNSITPIISLTELLTKYADNLEGDEDTKTEIRQMLQTIGRRGNGLVRFMNSYREVSHLPHPLLKLYNAGELLKEVVQLMQNDTNDLHLSLPNIPLRLIADKEQVEQVLINLIRNARETKRHKSLFPRASPQEITFSCVLLIMEPVSIRKFRNVFSFHSSPQNLPVQVSG